jgi:hypothetical protein
MREVLVESRECGVCGSRAQVVRETLNVEARVVTFLRELRGGGRVRAPRERSGLSYAAGYAGVLSLFHYPFMPFALSHVRLETALGALLVVGFWLFAPLALALAFAAGVSLDRSREKAGALPALFGFVVGLVGIVELLFTLGPDWLRYFKAF